MANLEFRVPSVIIVENDGKPRPIEGVNTSIAGFIGFTEDVRNGAEVHQAMLVTNWTQYCHYFARPNSDGYTDFDAYLPFAVSGYFGNGGGSCYVMSIGTQLPVTAQTALRQIASVQVFGQGNRPCLNLLSLCAEQADGGAIEIIISDSRPLDLPAGTQDEAPASIEEYFSLQLRRGDEVLEQYDNLTMNPDASPQVATYVVNALHDSVYVQVVNKARVMQSLNCRPQNGQYQLSLPLETTTLPQVNSNIEAAPPLEAMTPNQFFSDLEGSQEKRTGVRGMFENEQITMLAFPDLMRAYQAGAINLDQLHGMMEMMITTCEQSGGSNVPNCMVVLDPPPDRRNPQQMVEWLEEFGCRSMSAALYYPWTIIRNPRGDRPISVPPCGHVLGVWARTDQTRGVHKAPANKVLKGVIGLNYQVNHREQELLNPLGINCIRRFPNHGIRVWGARTLVEPDIEAWRYINVRRLMSYVEKSIQLGTQWAVFEPNDHRLWGRIRRAITNFLERIWRDGALVGRKPEDAFYVKCDADNNPPETMALGRVYIDIRVAPVRPAEFICFRISQMNYSEDDSP